MAKKDHLKLFLVPYNTVWASNAAELLKSKSDTPALYFTHGVAPGYLRTARVCEKHIYFEINNRRIAYIKRHQTPIPHLCFAEMSAGVCHQ